ncbi:MAG: hypothetical protein AB1499_07485 [Nitrospirota bacterium]
MKMLFTIDDFTALSLRLNLLLSVRPVDWRAVLSCMFARQLPSEAEARMLETLYYLEDAYGEQKRKVGTPAILHPIRSSAILARAHDSINTLDSLTSLLHDKDEDILSNGYSADRWCVLEERFGRLINKIENRQDKWFLNERIHFLARSGNESYNTYLTRLFRQAKETPELIRVKLADRLDNTLDLRLDFHDQTEDINFYHIIFRVLFDQKYRGLNVHGHHPSINKIHGARRLYEIFKNFSLFSILHSDNVTLDEASVWLLHSIANASIKEAQNVLVHIFAYHLKSLEDQRKIVRKYLDFSSAGDVSGDNRALAVLIRNTFEHEDRNAREVSLDGLYRDKTRMVEVAMAFIVLFSNYLYE